MTPPRVDELTEEEIRELQEQQKEEAKPVNQLGDKNEK